MNNGTITCACGYSSGKDLKVVLESKRIAMEIKCHLSKYLQGFCTLMCSFGT